MNIVIGILTVLMIVGWAFGFLYYFSWKELREEMAKNTITKNILEQIDQSTKKPELELPQVIDLGRTSVDTDLHIVASYNNVKYYVKIHDFYPDKRPYAKSIQRPSINVYNELGDLNLSAEAKIVEKFFQPEVDKIEETAKEKRRKIFLKDFMTDDEKIIKEII